MKKIITIVLCFTLVFSLAACGQPDDPSPSETGDEEQKKGKVLTEKEFKQMYSNPDKFKGERVDFHAQIFLQPERDEKGTYLQAYLDPDNSQNNIIVAINDPDLEVNKGDIIRVLGTVKGNYEGQNAFGAEISAPVIEAETIEKTDYKTAFAPAVKTVEVNKTQNHNGYIVKLNKLELAKQETRLYLTITNQTDNKITFYEFNTNLIQGNEQFDTKNNFAADYPELQTEILSGVETSGIIVFPPLDIDKKEVKIILEGSSSDYNVDIKPFRFNISW